MSAEELPATNPLPEGATANASGDALDTRPQSLTVAAVSRDGHRLTLVDETGREFIVDVDERLRAALPADAPRRSEKAAMNTEPAGPTLRPRDIQARIRAGESAESVAEAAGTTVEKIMPFAGPVLSERAHIADRAQKASVRRRAGDPAGTARVLGDAVAGQLQSLGIDPESVEWDAWRRADGRWSLVAGYRTPHREGTAELTFDAPGNFVSLDNDDARWLAGDLPDPVVEPEPVRDDLAQVRERRLSPAPPAAPEPTAPQSEAARHPQLEEQLSIEIVEHAVEGRQPSRPEAPAESAREQAQPAPEAPEPPIEQSAQTGSSTEESADGEQPPRRPAAKRRGRASVPSWDEIMFGGGSSDQG